MSNKDLHQFQHDLIENDSFIRWVKSDFINDDPYWSAFIDDHPDEMDEINSAIRFVRMLDFSSDAVIDKSALWNRIEATAQLPKKQIIKGGNLRSLKYIIPLLAAACMLFIFIFKPGMANLKQINTGLAQEVSEVLPDGSSILLNADSKIEYNAKHWGESRNVQLSGLAFFEVQKGKDFVVKTIKGDVSVLGTSFSVHARDDIFEVICKTGKVLVSNKLHADDIVTLNPGDKVYLTEGRLNLSKAENGAVNEISWMEGTFTFENQSLEIVAAELERQFDVKINISEKNRTMLYTGFFKKGDLNQALYAVTWPLKLKYRVEGSNIFIIE